MKFLLFFLPLLWVFTSSFSFLLFTWLPPPPNYWHQKFVILLVYLQVLLWALLILSLIYLFPISLIVDLLYGISFLPVALDFILCSFTTSQF